jgi:hypothetical protein
MKIEQKKWHNAAAPCCKTFRHISRTHWVRDSNFFNIEIYTFYREFNTSNHMVNVRIYWS